MRLLKKFEFPLSFESSFNEDIMDKNGKKSISHFADNYKYGKRNRANTYYASNRRKFEITLGYSYNSYDNNYSYNYNNKNNNYSHSYGINSKHWKKDKY